MVALYWAIPAALALTALLRRLPDELASSALRCALGLWIAALFVFLPLMLSRS